MRWRRFPGSAWRASRASRVESGAGFPRQPPQHHRPGPCNMLAPAACPGKGRTASPASGQAHRRTAARHLPGPFRAAWEATCPPWRRPCSTWPATTPTSSWCEGRCRCRVLGWSARAGFSSRPSASSPLNTANFALKNLRTALTDATMGQPKGLLYGGQQAYALQSRAAPKPAARCCVSSWWNWPGRGCAVNRQGACTLLHRVGRHHPRGHSQDPRTRPDQEVAGRFAEVCPNRVRARGAQLKAA